MPRAHGALQSFLRATAITLVTVALALLLAVQIELALFRHRAAQLLDDFHSIHLLHSDWNDAQRLMTRWGKFAHYEGSCTPHSCSYFIVMPDTASALGDRLYEFASARWPKHYSGDTYSRVLNGLGGRSGSARMSFLVESGIIHRASVAMRVAVPPHLWSKDDEFGYGIGWSVRANDHLWRGPREKAPWILGDQEQLARHPEFKAGRPTGCEGCMNAELTYTPYIDQADLLRLTDFQLNCFSTWHRCIHLPDLVPATSEWHFYEETAQPDKPENHCTIPTFAIARDASAIVLFSAASTQTIPAREPDSDRPRQVVSGRLLRILESPWKLPTVGSSLKVLPDAWINFDPVYHPERMQPGHNYLLFLRGMDEAAGLAVGWCGTIEDSPAAEAQLQEGLRRHDPLHTPDLFAHPAW